MAVSRMKMVSVLGPLDMLDRVIDVCIDSGYVQPEQTSSVVSNVSGFSHMNDENPYSSQLSSLCDVFNSFGVEPELINVSEAASDEEIKGFLDYLREQLLATQARRAELNAQIAENKTAIEQLGHFSDMHIELEKVFACEYVRVRFGRIPCESYEKLKKYKGDPYMLFLPCSSDGTFYWGMYVAPTDHIDHVDRIFASLFFERLHIPDGIGTPNDAIEQLKDDLGHKQAQLKKLDRIIDEYFRDNHDHCMQVYSYLKRKSLSFEVRRYCVKYKDSFLMINWVAENECDKYIAKLKNTGKLDITVDDAENIKKVTPPSKLKNKRVFRPFEMFVSMYGVPNYNETDPTAFVAIIYTLLYGIMFADLGQGIVLSIVGWLMYKIKGMQLGKILIPCGISGAVFGTIFGSVFGFEEALNPLFGLLGFEKKPINVIESAVMLLIAAVAIGVCLVIVAMCLNIVSSFKRKDIASAVFGPNGFAGIILYSCIILLIINLAAGLGISNKLLLLAGVLVPVIIIFLREPLANLFLPKDERKKIEWGEYCLENGSEMFEVLLSYVTNTISFLRVGAFVLVHAGMMLVFFSLAEMMPNAFLYAVMVIFGNVFVIVLEGLLVGIQVLRLVFYEMFSRFYNGDGRDYQPMSLANSQTE